MMKRDEIVAALRWLRPESGDFACDGCGWENSCGARGCQIMREAADMLENDETCDGVLRDAIEKWKKAYGTLREKHSALLEQNGKLRDAAADVTRLAAEAAVERDWIRVEDRLPEPGVDVLAAYRDRHINMGTAGDDWLEEDIEDGYITHWMPLPEPPEEDNHGPTDI